MALIVQKFGGTSVGTMESIRQVAARIRRERARGHDLVVVVSAMAGETNRLLELAQGVDACPDPAELAVLLSTGEQVAASLLCMELSRLGCPARSCMGWQVAVRTDGRHENACIEHVDTGLLRAELRAGRVVVVTGFQGVDAAGRVTVLGRGGSDITAVALAAALEADECQVYTDVDGVYTADPGVVDKAWCLEQISFEEMAELSSLGAGVLQSRSVTVAASHGLRLRVLNSFREGPGTLVTSEGTPSGPLDAGMESLPIAGVACSRNETGIAIRGIPETAGVMGQILGTMDRAGLQLDMVSLTPSDVGRYDFSCALPQSGYRRAMILARRLALRLRARACEGKEGLAKVSVVGMGMRSRTGLVSRLLDALEAEKIGVRMLSGSDLRMSVIVEGCFAQRAVELVHRACGLSPVGEQTAGLQTDSV